MRAGLLALGALAVAAACLLAVELARGGADYGGSLVQDPCRERATFPGRGLDATLQRIVLDGLDGAACELGTTREELVLSLDPALAGEARWDRETIERAVRAGLLEAIDDAQDRGGIGGLEATLFRAVVERAPIGWLIEGGGALADLFDRR